MEFIQQEILEQVDIARRIAEADPPTWPEAPRRVLVTGCGDSLAAGELVAALHPHRRMEPLPAMFASEAAHKLGPRDALIGVSVSGRTPRVIEAILRAKARGAQCVAVTDDPSSPLGEAAGTTWSIGASPLEELESSTYKSADASQYVGYHRDVAQTKTILASFLTLARAAEGTDRRATDWNRLADSIAHLVTDAFAAPIRERAEGWAQAGQAFFLASPSAMPLARLAAYKMFEFNRVAHFSDIEEYCHTHYFVTRPGDALVFLVTDETSALRVAEIEPVLADLFDARCLVVHVGSVALPFEPSAPPLTVPTGGSALESHVALLVALEWITYLWGRVGAPDIDNFHAGYDTERLVSASLRTIRRSEIRAVS